MDFAHIDAALMERLGVYRPLEEEERIFSTRNNDQADTHLWFLFKSYQRAMHFESKHKEKADVIKRCKDICISFSESLISEPEAFGFENSVESTFEIIKSEYANSNFHSFLKDLMDNDHEKQKKNQIFNDVVLHCMKLLSSDGVKITDDIFMAAVHLLNVYADIPKLCEIMLKSDVWLPRPNIKLDGAIFEKTTFLGQILKATSIYKVGEESQFSGISDNSEASATVSYFRSLIKNICDGVVEAFKKIFRNKDLRNRLYIWIFLAIRANQNHAKLGARLYEEIKERLSSNGFFINLSFVLLRLLHPIVRSWGSKFDKIDFKILENPCIIHENRFSFEALDFSKETKLAASEDSEPQKPCDMHQFNFMTVIYFLTPWAISIALVPLWEEYRKAMMILQENQPENPYIPHDDPEFKQFQTLLNWQIAFKAHLCSEDLIEMLGDALGAYSSHMLHIIGCKIFNGFNVSYSPVNPIPSILRYIPEFVIEMIPPCTLSICDFARETFLSSCENVQAIVCMCSVFMGSSDLLRNPHLRAKLAECLGILCDFEKQSESLPRSMYQLNMYNCITSFPFLPKLLVQNLMQLFIDIEFTGDANAFYQKFSYRRTMYLLLEYLWNIKEINAIFIQFSSDAIASELKDNIPIFLRFINLLVNDANFLLEESFSLLPQIQALEREINDPTIWNGFTDEIKEQKKEKYEQTRKSVTSYNVLSLQTVEILQLITNDIKQIFVWSVLEDRMACMLNLFLSSLVGSRKKNLKVKEMQELKFEPKKLLTSICNIYANLSDEEKFPQALIRDARSFDLSLFDEARTVLDQICCPSGVIMAMMKLKRKVIRLMKEGGSALDDSDLNIPDEFLDPISCSLMEDPVIMPTSKITVDRTIITQHLLSCSQDPFNRMDLTVEMLIPNDELKKKIEDWKASQKKPKQS